MADPHPSVAAVRVAVRSAVERTSPDALVLAAVSGGADSLALMAALAFEAPRRGRRVAVVHVDHGLQRGSAEQARQVVDQAHGLGVPDARVCRVYVDVARGGRGPEGSARAARYAALDAEAERSGAEQVHLGHTLDDQAEQVLLGLARGAGARSLAGMPPERGRYVRPLLGLTRELLVEACRQQGLAPWADPSNVDPAYTRNRVRHRVLPVLEAELGPGIAAALARTAELLRDDADLLDDLAADGWAACSAASPDGADEGLSVAALLALPPALRGRVLRTAALGAGAPASDLTLGHVRAVEALVLDWRGQGPIPLPGGLVAVRRCDRLVVEAP
ncbi:MAG TPA: tRNA lysidine(34) synthetase TilS [Mycobacteriales bacterium]|nr:tRNA lysidine(34) synthetase TilS [Mycobacteriales bacterium]